MAKSIEMLDHMELEFMSPSHEKGHKTIFNLVFCLLRSMFTVCTILDALPGNTENKKESHRHIQYTI